MTASLDSSKLKDLIHRSVSSLFERKKAPTNKFEVCFFFFAFFFFNRQQVSQDHGKNKDVEASQGAVDSPGSTHSIIRSTPVARVFSTNRSKSAPKERPKSMDLSLSLEQLGQTEETIQEGSLTDRQSEPLQRALVELHKSRKMAGRPELLHQMTVPQLSAEKNEIKKQLRNFDEEFELQNGVPVSQNQNSFCTFFFFLSFFIKELTWCFDS
jgi:hypothetical protein